ncbi:MAG TPA: 4-hydroxythreonine-4-phosphate dehydrogenase PdxA [Bryobacteraceae bacterium]|nr:4-hydroxythreonine-4-phosphate dehydrogenase PdxA [Bryobacteraceae bacterium]
MHNLPYGVTIGDTSGIGPEILLKAFAAGELTWPVVAFGDLEALRFYNHRLGYNVPLRAVQSPADYEAGALNVLDHQAIAYAEITPGTLNAKAGSAAREYVVSATRAALADEIAAMVTLPMNKEATRLSDPRFTGHTELIGSLCGTEDVTIMLASDDLIVTHVSTHMSLLDAIRTAKQSRIQTIIELTARAVANLIDSPRIAVAGLNPHAGENGLFGDEEIREIVPAVKWAQAQGFPVSGPFPPDTLFYLAVRRKQFDAVVCMYHDQGHVPLKLLDFEGGVNITLGLPIIRTSVDHGTAFDIAGQGIASTHSLIRAMQYADKLASGPRPQRS